MSPTCTRSCCSSGVFGLSFAALLALACQRPEDRPEVQAARAAVFRYDERLPAAFRAQDQSLLGDAAGEAETDRVGAVIAGLAKRGEVMIARLVDLRVERAHVKLEDLVVVDTVETWRYEHRRAKEPDRPVPPKERTYRMSYQVGRRGTGWQVKSATTSEETTPAGAR